MVRFFSFAIFLWVEWTTAFSKSLGNVIPVSQELIFLCKISPKRLGNPFIIFVAISLSWVAFFMPSHFISFEISPIVTHAREKLQSVL